MKDSGNDVIEQREGCFNLELMGGASTASYLLVELPALFTLTNRKGKGYPYRLALFLSSWALT